MRDTYAGGSVAVTAGETTLCTVATDPADQPTCPLGTDTATLVQNGGRSVSN